MQNHNTLAIPPPHHPFILKVGRRTYEAVHVRRIHFGSPDRHERSDGLHSKVVTSRRSSDESGKDTGAGPRTGTGGARG